MFLGGEILYASGAPVLVAASKETPLDHVILETRGACAPGHIGIIIPSVTQKGAHTLVWHPHLLHLVSEDTSTSPDSFGQWSLCLWVPRIVTNGQRILKQLQPSRHNKKQQAQEPGLSVKEVY